MRKAITPIIGTIVLLLIAIALAGSAWLYISGYLGGQISTAFSIVDTYKDRIIIKNQGTAAITDLTAFVDGNPATTVFDLNKDLVAYWKFDEGSGNKAKDIIQGLEVNLNGEWVEGKAGYAYKFVGGGWIATSFEKGVGNGVSYVLWFKLPDTSDTYGTFVCLEDVSDVYLEDNLGQSTSTYGDTACSGKHWYDSSLVVKDTNWHMYVFSKGSNSILCRDNMCGNVGDATNNIPNIGKLYFNGGCGCGWGNFAQGIIIDEFRIYDRALTQEEINALYAAGGKTILEPGRMMTLRFSNLSEGQHIVKLCSGSMCQTAYLRID